MQTLSWSTHALAFLVQRDVICKCIAHVNMHARSSTAGQIRQWLNEGFHRPGARYNDCASF